MQNRKFITTACVKKITADYKKKGKKIVFTNGCFDLLHYGHIRYLESAKKLGDVLIIGLNSNRSVRKLKGPNRPLNTQLVRVKQLAALAVVDYITVFSSQTPYTLIKTIKPDILVKGGDWKKTAVVGREFVIKNGGRVKIIPYIKGFSTTLLIKKIKAL
ncbi:MAG: D-glycero-beta-D-manno-heptose 1-phosphate adenylyltransferase [Candidatus Omnitrophota bacterium]